jgi:hypothetical protein
MAWIPHRMTNATGPSYMVNGPAYVAHRPHEFNGVICSVIDINANYYSVFRSTDQGETWTEAATIPCLNDGAVTRCYATRESGRYLWIGYVDAARKYSLVRFDMTTDTLSTPYQSGISLQGNNVWFELLLRSDDTLVFVFLMQPPRYLTCTTAGTWGSLTSVPFGFTVNGGSVGMGANDRMHFIAIQASDGAHYQTSVDASYALESAAPTGYVPAGMPYYGPCNIVAVNMLGGVYMVTMHINANSSVRGRSQANPVSWTLEAAPAVSDPYWRNLVPMGTYAIGLSQVDNFSVEAQTLLQDGTWTAPVKLFTDPLNYPQYLAGNRLADRYGVVYLAGNYWTFVTDVCGGEAPAPLPLNYAY